MKMTPLTVDCSVTPPSQGRIPVVDQAMELAKMMEPYRSPDDIRRLLISAARTWEMATTFVIKVDSP